jgi:citrate synthase
VDALTADEACAVLGVKKATLYTYVSRGMVRAYGAGRTRRYDASDVDELRRRSASVRGHGAAASSSMDWGAPVLESTVTSIDVDGPNYRGVPALGLAEDDVAYERVAELLWTGGLPDDPPAVVVDGLGVDAGAFETLIPADAPVPAALGLAVQALAATDPLRGLLAERGEPGRARAVVRRLAALSARVVGSSCWQARAAASLAAPSLPGAARWVNRALVLVADHELNASAFAGRVAAGTGADLYGVLAAAIAAWSGPRHGTASEALEAALDPWTAGRPWSAGGVAACFGHRLYPGGDPRGERLLADARAIGGDDPRWKAVVDLLPRMAEAGHPPPNLDLGLVALVAACRLPPRTPQLLFGLGRTAGWLAHGWEQRGTGRTLRPRARYVGP